jgi:hypothetical protein
MRHLKKAGAQCSGLLLFERSGNLLSCDGLDRNEATHAPAIDKLHFACDLGKERVVAATAHIEARLQTRAALPHNDRSAGDQLASEGLYAQSLCI